MSYTPLPIGVDDFYEIRKKEYYYVDKTLLIKELLDKKGNANLFTRPRRFGKTLNLSMLKYFFEIPEEGDSHKDLFEGLAIMAAGEKYISEQEQYPVIMMTLKSAKQPSYEYAYSCLKDIIADEFRRHSGIISKLRDDTDKKRYKGLMGRKSFDKDYLTALQFLSKCLFEVYGKKVIILLDEYDVPLENSYYTGFYDKMVVFIRSLFESALKTNPYLEFAVITGCLRISKESIFTGLNNLNVISILDSNYGEYFGFTEKEVKSILEFYQHKTKMDIMKKWYDGYIFGQTEVYNPWSVLNYIYALEGDKEAFPTSAWSNSSSNAIIKDLIYQADEDVRDEIESLIQGETIEKSIHEDITYEDIYKSQDNLWNFLFFTGYLKLVGKRMIENEMYGTFSIPNVEVKQIYKNTIINWFREKIEVKDLSIMYGAMLEGKADIFQRELLKQLRETISYMDSKESFYHGFLLGVMANLKEYRVKSNREAGDGRYDICIYSHDETIPPVILELKVSKKFKDMEADAIKALNQIEEKNYDEWLPEEGFTECIRYGIAFYKKKCRIRMIRKELE